MSFAAQGKKKIAKKFPHLTFVGDVANGHRSELGTAMVAGVGLGGNLLQDTMSAHAVN